VAGKSWTFFGAFAAAALLVALGPAPPTAASPLPPRDLIFFLHYVNASEGAKPLPGSGSIWTYFDTTTEWNDVNVTLMANGSLQSYDWYLAPALPGNVTVSAVSLAFWAQFVSGVASGQTTVELSERSASGAEALVSTGNFGSESYSYTPSLKQLNWTLTNAHAFSAGSSIKVTLKINLGGGSMLILFDTARADSRLTLRTADALRITGAQALDSVGAPVASLDPVSNNTTARLRATVQDPYGGGDIAWVRMTVLADNGSTIVENATASPVAGTPASLTSSFEASWNYSGLAPGRYLVLVFAMDNSGQSWYEHFANFAYGPYGDSTSFPVFIGGLPLYAWVRLVDDRGLPVEGASIELAGARGGGGQSTTDAAGMANLTGAPGLYTLVATWTQTEVARVPFNFADNITAGSPLELSGAVFYPTLRLVDNRSLPLADAAVSYTHPNGSTTLSPLVTAADGSVSLGRTAGGSYHVIARWETVAVLDVAWAVDKSGTTTLVASVFAVDFWLLDSRDAGVAFAALVVRDNASGLVLGYAVANASGAAPVRLPGAFADIAAWTRDIQVVDVGHLLVAADGRVDLLAAVYYVELAVVDDAGAPLADAQATVRSAAGTVTDALATNATGTLTLRLPAATYALTVSWSGVTVASIPSLVVASDLSRAVTVSVYHVAFMAVDSRGLVVAAATLVLREQGRGVAGTNITGADGSASVQLPAGNYSLQVFWRERVVFELDSMAVDQNVNRTLALAVSYLTARLTDSRGNPLVEATVRAENRTGEPLAVASTGTTGAALLRLPDGSFTLSATWRNVTVLEAAAVLHGDLDAVYPALVAYLTVLVVDREGRPLHDTIVSVSQENGSQGALLAYTGLDGTAAFQLPAGRYGVTARLIATYLLSPIDETELRTEDIAASDARVTIVMSKFQPELVQTNAFAVALLFLVSVTGLAAFVYVRYQRPGRPQGEEKDLEAAAPVPGEGPAGPPPG
jgi:hypothetical protein